MTLTLGAVLSAGYLEMAGLTPAPNDRPRLTLGELEGLVAFARLEVARHLGQREAANSPDARLSLEAVETELLTALDGISSAITAIERDLAWWDGGRAA